jgi:hypothetical protein
MLDWDPPKEDASEDDGGVLDPEPQDRVQVLERKRPMVLGLTREKEISWAMRRLENSS